MEPTLQTPARPADAARARRTGTVRKVSGINTISVDVLYYYAHPKYGKRLQRTTRLAVHCEDATVKAGDVVRIVSCRPISKTKRWRLDEVITRTSGGPMATS